MKQWLVALSLLTMFGCSQAPPPPQADTREADTKALHDHEVAMNQEIAAKDIDKLAAHYADDGAVLAPNMPAMSGKEAIKAGFKGLLVDMKGDLKFETAK